MFVQAAISSSSIQRKALWRIGSTLFIGAIFTLVVGLAATGRVISNPSVPVVGIAVACMLAPNLSLLFFSASYRELADRTPMHWLIASNFIRIGPGIAFLGLLDMGLLPHDLAIQAGYGDIIAGITGL